MKKIVLNQNKKDIIDKNKINSNDIIYIIINCVLDIANQMDVKTTYTEILNRIKTTNLQNLNEILIDSGCNIKEDDNEIN